MFSQNNEEEIIIEALTGVPPGKFLDIGAYDGRSFSNTMRLTELGWGGICFEPSPSVFPALLKLHGDNEKIGLVNAAITPSGGLLEFWDSGGDAISTTNLAHMEKWKAGWKCNFKNS
jgi:FkbM family methyltransferase